MTKKDYELIAGTFKAYRENCLSSQRPTVDKLAVFLADNLRADNDRFNRDTFLKACGQ